MVGMRFPAPLLLLLGWCLGGMMAATTSSSAVPGAAATSSFGTSSPAEIGSSASSSASVSLADELAPVTNMDAGSFHVVVIIRDSTVNVVKDWGANGKGQLGLNDTKDRGDNNGDVGNLLPEVVLGTDLQAVHVTAGLRHTAAIMNDETVRGWGYNRKGQLGVGTLWDVGDEAEEMGDFMAVTELGDVTPVAISAGGWHTCVIVVGDLVKCWGYNQWGELGLEDKDDRGDDPDEMGDNLDFVDLGSNARVFSLALGDWHSCALLDGGDVKCFGKNYAGQLGYGDTENRGDDPGEMGDDLDTVNLNGKKATAIAAGEEHTCAILEDGDLICWGLGSSGQLGQGNAMNVGDGEGEDVSSLDPIDLGTGRTAIEVTAGGNHTCALLDNYDVKCWGENDYGELGQEDTQPRGLAPNQMGDNLEAISLPTGWTLHSLSAGYYHTCALGSEIGSVDSVVCWGANFNGQIGLGISETEHIGDEEGEMGENLQMANLGGEFVAEPGDEWYEQQWFYIACGCVGAVLLCCLFVLCRQAHGDSSGRGPVKTRAVAKPRTGETPANGRSPVPGYKKSPVPPGYKKSPLPGSEETPNGSAGSGPNSHATAPPATVPAAAAAVGAKTRTKASPPPNNAAKSGKPGKAGRSGGMIGPNPSSTPAAFGGEQA
ncbi:unnamed protein product [Ectocarpus sp. CCAP 1310/34]|nr:unnamed protein product [Ectocarpus sp. CCAP 1310/34]